MPDLRGADRPLVVGGRAPVRPRFFAARDTSSVVLRSFSSSYECADDSDDVLDMLPDRRCRLAGGGCVLPLVSSFVAVVVSCRRPFARVRVDVRVTESAGTDVLRAEERCGRFEGDLRTEAALGVGVGGCWAMMGVEGFESASGTPELACGFSALIFFRAAFTCDWNS